MAADPASLGGCGPRCSSAATLVLAALLGGCGGSTPAAQMPARTRAPRPRRRARRGAAGRPGGLAAAARAGPRAASSASARARTPSAPTSLGRQFAVAVHDPARLVLVGARSGRVSQRVAVPGAVPRPGDPTPAVFLLQGELGRDAVAVSSGGAARVGRRRARQDVRDRRRRGRRARPRRPRRPLLHRDDRDRAPPTPRRTSRSSPARAASWSSTTRGRCAGSPRSPRPPARRTSRRSTTACTSPTPPGTRVLTYATQPRLHRVAHRALAGAPYAIAVDPIRRILAVTLTAVNGLTLIPLTAPTARHDAPHDPPTRRPRHRRLDLHDRRRLPGVGHPPIDQPRRAA